MTLDRAVGVRNLVLGAMLAVVGCQRSAPATATPGIGASEAESAEDAPAKQFGAWSVNMVSENDQQPGTPAARDDFGRRLNILVNAMKARREQGFPTDLIALQEASTGGDHTISCPNGQTVHAGECLAQQLGAQTGHRFAAHTLSYFGVVFDTSVFELQGGPFFVRNVNPGYEKLQNGSMYGVRLKHLETGLTFQFVSIHLAVTGGYHHQISTNHGEPEYHLDGLYLAEKYVRDHHVAGDGLAIVAGDFNHNFSTDKDNRVPFSVFDPAEPDRDAIDLALIGPRGLQGTSATHTMQTVAGQVRYFIQEDIPPGDTGCGGKPCPCKTWAEGQLQAGKSFSDHCALASVWKIQKRTPPTQPSCSAGLSWCKCTSSCLKPDACPTNCE